VATFRSTTSGGVLEPVDRGYKAAAKMLDGRFRSTPGFISLVTTEKDVSASLSFAQKHNLKVSVKNTGHDYDGRCTAANSLMINVKEMKSIVGAPDSVQVGAGNNWGDVNKFLTHFMHGSKTIVGGAIDSVGVTGWMQGGGHGDLTRSHGLGVDNVLSVRIVVADGRAVTASAEENSDLFWALRGGGGGSWGVITQLTIRIHTREHACQLMLAFPLLGVPTAHVAAEAFAELLVNGDDKMGGGEFIPTGSVGGLGVVMMIMRYHGTREESEKALEPLSRHAVGSILPAHLWCGMEGFHPAMPSGYNLPLNGPVALISNFLDAESITTKHAMTKIMDWVTKPLSVLALRGCFGQLIGGYASRVPDNATAVHPGFRKGLIAMSCYGFPFEPLYEFANSEFNNWGDGGAYVNEPQSRLPDWKERFWTMAKYEQLLAIKKKWDPENVFIVHQGVGWDGVSNEEDNSIIFPTPDSNDTGNRSATKASGPTVMPDCSKTTSPSDCQCAVENCATEIHTCLADTLCAAGIPLSHSPLILTSSAKGVAALSCVDKACPSSDSEVTNIV